MTLKSSVSLSAVLGSQSDDLAMVEQLAAALGSRPDVSGPHVIQLSPAAGPLKSGDMTQQQRIAAALIKAGISNPAAWSAAGLEAQPVQVTEEHANATGEGASTSTSNGSPTDFDLHPPTVLMQGTNDKTFLISWRSQEEIARSLRWKSNLLIWGGPVVALLSLYLLLNTRGLW